MEEPDVDSRDLVDLTSVTSGDEESNKDLLQELLGIGSGSIERNLSGRLLLLFRSLNRALTCFTEGELARAFAHFVVAFTICPSIIQVFDKTFLRILGKYTSKLKAEGRCNDILECCRQVLEIFPKNPDVLHELGSLLYRMNLVDSAITYYLKAYFANPYYSHSLYCLENIKNSMIERWHFSMLNDKDRNMAFCKSIERAVKSGYARVLDIGSGTGILSLMAVDSGAREVYACEKNPYMCEVLHQVIEENGKSDSVHILEKLSTSLTIPSDIPERVNLVVTETFDSCLFGEHILKTLEHAWEELLCNKYIIPENLGGISCNSGSDYTKHMQVSAKVIPHSATLWAVPVECDRIRAYARLNTSKATSMTALISEPYTSERLSALPGGFKYLSSPKAAFHVNFNDLQDIKKLLKGKSVSLQYKCSDGILDAFVMWFDLNLDDVVTITNAPDRDGCWEQAVFYVLPEHLRGSSRTLQMGDSVHTTFHCEGHVNLLNVRTPRADQPPSYCVTCKPEVICQLNFLLPAIVSGSELWGKEILKKSGSVIDLLPYPILGMRALAEGPTELIVFDLETRNEVEKMMEIKNIPKEAITFMPSEDFENCPTKAGLLFHHPVDMCGLLKKGILETIIYLRNTCLTDSAVVIPGKLEIFCTLIDSPTLLKQTRLVSDENTVGYRISSSINAFQGQLHFDIDISTLPFEQLSDNIKLCDIDLNCVTESDLNNLHGNLEVEMTRNGTIMAVPFWFAITYYEDTIVDTSNSSTLYRVAASIPTKEIEVSQGDYVTLHWTCKNSCVHVLVNKME